MSSSDWIYFISLGLFAVWVIWLTWENQKLRKIAAYRETLYEEEHTSRLDAQIGLSDAKAERDILKGLIEAQNKKLSRLEYVKKAQRKKLNEIRYTIDEDVIEGYTIDEDVIEGEHEDV